MASPKLLTQAELAERRRKRLEERKAAGLKQLPSFDDALEAVEAGDAATLSVFFLTVASWSPYRELFLEIGRALGGIGPMRLQFKPNRGKGRPRKSLKVAILDAYATAEVNKRLAKQKGKPSARAAIDTVAVDLHASRDTIKKKFYRARRAGK